MLIWCSAYPVKSSRTIAISIDKGITVTTIEAGRHPRKTKTTNPTKNTPCNKLLKKSLILDLTAVACSNGVSNFIDFGSDFLNVSAFLPISSESFKMLPPFFWTYYI